MRLGNKDYKDPEYLLQNMALDDSGNLLRDLYTRYVNIRYMMNGNGCNKAKFFEVYEKAKQPENMQRICNTYGITPEEVHEQMTLAYKYIPMIK